LAWVDDCELFSAHDDFVAADYRERELPRNQIISQKNNLLVALLDCTYQFISIVLRSLASDLDIEVRAGRSGPV
jgi:hypothetical protein